MEFCDTHCHLNFESFREDLNSVINRALENKVTKIIVPGVDLESSKLAVQLADEYPPIFAAVGVHPSDITSFSSSQVEDFSILLAHNKVVAVGEIGLDYYHHQDNKNKQIALLEMMLELARSHRKPILLHCRVALPDLIKVLSDRSATETDFQQKGIFHAFEGDYHQACSVQDMGFLIGAGGPVTYTNASKKHELFSKIGLKCIVLETDSPFLSPQQLRGKRNEPGNIPIIAQKIAELRNSTLMEIAENTTRNAKLLFDWID